MAKDLLSSRKGKGSVVMGGPKKVVPKRKVGKSR